MHRLSVIAMALLFTGYNVQAEDATKAPPFDFAVAAEIASDLDLRSDGRSHPRFTDEELIWRAKNAEKQMRAIMNRDEKREASDEVSDDVDFWLMQAYRAYQAIHVERQLCREAINAANKVPKPKSRFPHDLPD